MHVCVCMCVTCDSRRSVIVGPIDQINTMCTRKVYVTSLKAFGE